MKLKPFTQTKSFFVLFAISFWTLIFIALTSDAGVNERRKKHNVQFQRHIQTFQKVNKKNGYNSRMYQNFNMRPKKHFRKI